MRTGTNAIIIRDGEILLVKKRDLWLFPGGKYEEGESCLECLSREVSEELDVTKIKNIRYYGNFKGISPYSKQEREIRVYFADIDGELYGTRAGDSVVDFNWTRNPEGYDLTDITRDIINSLRVDGYLE
jgi:ADP-ribose pyrophosphatase YjhB (NUDIX family)